MKHLLFGLFLLYPNLVKAEPVWNCGGVYTNEEKFGCRPVNTSFVQGKNGMKMFTTSDAPSFSTHLNENSPFETEESQNHGTLFHTENERPLKDAPIRHHEMNAPHLPGPTEGIDLGALPKVLCVFQALSGDKEAARKCGLPEEISVPDIAKALD